MMDIDKIIDQIKKCVRLANRTSEEGERETALRLAKNLADKNGIALDDIDVGESTSSKAVMIQDEEYKYWSGCEMGLAYYILDRHFGVIVMITPLRHNREKKRHTWIGSALNIDIAKHVLHILLRECRKSYEEERNRPDERIDQLRRILYGSGFTDGQVKKEVAIFKRRHVSREAFMRGFFYQIDQKLTANPLRNDIASDQAEAKRKLEEYKKDHNVKDQKARNGKNLNAKDFTSGLKAANSVNLARPCESNGISPLALANAVEHRLTA